MSVFGRAVVFVDSNVWFSRTLRDWVGQLYLVADISAFEVRWSEDVLAEVIYHLRAKHPTWPGGRISGVRDRIVATFETGRVTDFQLDEAYLGADPRDAHVHAAAVACRADILLTCNGRDFVWDENSSPYDVLHPDEFFSLLNETHPEVVMAAVVATCRYWMAREGEADLPARLKAAGCPNFAEVVREHLMGRAGMLCTASSQLA